MAPVQVHTASPINTNLPSTAFVGSSSTAATRYTPFALDSRPTSTNPSPCPSPLSQTAALATGAAPQPTNNLANSSNNRLEPTKTVPLESTPTRSSSNSPPSPQPGAVPSPCPSPSFRSMVTAPPRPLDIPQPNRYQHPNESPPRPTTVVAQADTPSHRRPLPMQSPTHTPPVFTPTRSIPPAGVTSSSTSPSYNYTSPTYSLPQAPATQFHDLSHPPGYQQDHHSSFDDKPVEFCQEMDYRATLSPLSASSRRGVGILDMEWTFGSPTGSANGENTVVKTAMSWAKAAGKRLSMTEKQIWKTINGEEDGS